MSSESRQPKLCDLAVNGRAVRFEQLLLKAEAEPDTLSCAQLGTVAAGRRAGESAGKSTHWPACRRDVGLERVPSCRARNYIERPSDSEFSSMGFAPAVRTQPPWSPLTEPWTGWGGPKDRFDGGPTLATRSLREG
jgi:hypothetical protein